ncbi:MAG: GNAT family N-acetyltransferase [Paraclostridium sp.]|uniref:GNAT family N-acetyltransferase n=1 Tax=Paraclostridium sp. TaxID=2023273 RepID=UPI003F33C42D
MTVILETDRLILRKFKSEDLDSLYEYRNDEECGRYQRWENTELEYLKEFIENEKNKELKEDNIQVAIELKANKQLIGDIFIAFKEKTVTIGYTISPKYQRKGYAYETLKELINYIFERFTSYDEIVAMVHPDNLPSKNLIEKLNFKKEGYFEKVSSIIYSMQL